MNVNLAKGLLPLILIAQPLWADGVWSAESIEREVDTSATPSVSIDIDAGVLTVETWDQNRVRVEGTLDDRVEELELALPSSEAVAIVVEEYRRGMTSSGNSDTRLTIHVPVGTRLLVETINAEINVAGVQGDVDVESVNGPISVRDSKGHVSLAAVNGSIEVRQLSGDAEIEAINGRIDVEQIAGDVLELSSVNGSVVAKATARDVELSSVNGVSHLELGDVRRLSADTVGGEIRARLKLQRHGDLNADSVSGRLHITLVKPLDVSVNVESMSGRIRNHISDDKPQRGELVPFHSLDFVLGDASADVRISTLSGTVDLLSD